MVDTQIATAPVLLQPGSGVAVLARAAAAERHLQDGLPDGYSLVGFSTPINVGVDDRRVVGVARLIAARLALPLMLVLDRADSPGLLVRPRPGRLEIGGEFAAGDPLRTAVALTVAVTALAERACRTGRLMHPVPRTPRLRPARAVERYGWYVDRHGWGPDLYRQGRETVLGSRTAGEWLRVVWHAARPLTRDLLDDDERSLVDDAVSGARPLPLEHPLDDDGPVQMPPGDQHYGPRDRGDLQVVVVQATWCRALVEIRTPTGIRWLTLPGRALDDVLALDAGLLDRELSALLPGDGPLPRQASGPTIMGA